MTVGARNVKAPLLVEGRERGHLFLPTRRSGIIVLRANKKNISHLLPEEGERRRRWGTFLLLRKRPADLFHGREGKENGEITTTAEEK